MELLLLGIISKKVIVKATNLALEEFYLCEALEEKTGRRPDKNSNNEEEVRMAYALAKLSDMRARRNENR